jgi:hypothetical protein
LLRYPKQERVSRDGSAKTTDHRGLGHSRDADSSGITGQRHLGIRTSKEDTYETEDEFSRFVDRLHLGRRSFSHCSPSLPNQINHGAESARASTSAACTE